MCQLRIFWSVTHRVLALIWSTCSKVDQSRNFWWAISWNLDFNALWRETLLKGPKTFVNGSRHPSVPDSKTILVQISQSYDMYTCHICIHMTYVIYAPICTCTYAFIWRMSYMHPQARFKSMNLVWSWEGWLEEEIYSENFYLEKGVVFGG